MSESGKTEDWVLVDCASVDVKGSVADASEAKWCCEYVKLLISPDSIGP